MEQQELILPFLLPPPHANGCIERVTKEAPIKSIDHTCRVNNTFHPSWLRAIYTIKSNLCVCVYSVNRRVIDQRENPWVDKKLLGIPANTFITETRPHPYNILQGSIIEPRLPPNIYQLEATLFYMFQIRFNFFSNNGTVTITSSLSHEHFGIRLLRGSSNGRSPAISSLFRKAETIGIAFWYLRASLSNSSGTSSSWIVIVLFISRIAVLRRRNRISWRSVLSSTSAATAAEFRRRLRHGPFYDGRAQSQERHGFADARLAGGDGRKCARTELYGGRRSLGINGFIHRR